MMKNNIRVKGDVMKGKKRVFSLLTALLFTAGIFAFDVKKVKGTEIELYNKQIAKSIIYTEKQIYTSSNVKQRMNIITADLKDSDVNVIFSKAKDTVNKYNTLTQQIQREIFKGNNVVAGINGDMFSMTTGVSTGPQIKEGAILAGYFARSEEKIYPAFGIDQNKKPFIENIYMEGKLTANGETVDIFNINRESYKNNIIVLTPQINESKNIDFSSYASNGALTIVRGVKSPIKLGVEYEGIVESLGIGSKSIKIPEDCVVIASNGTKFDWIKSHVKEGDKIKFKFDFNKKGINEAIGTYAYIVKDGRALTVDEMVKNGAAYSQVTARKARSAVGITRDNKIIAVAVDYGKPSSGISDGITFSEMAKVMLDMGAVTAAALDGGGSTQMNVRLYGNNFIDVVNRPSDGRERAITNGILFVSSSSKTYEAGDIIVDKDIYIYKNSNFKFNLKGVDTNLNPINLSNSSIVWSTEGGIGSIDSNGNFKAASKASEGNVIASLKSTSGKAYVNVVDTLDSLSIKENGPVLLQTGAKKQFYLDAKCDGEIPVIISSSAAKWSVTGNIGTIDSNGVLNITSKKGYGTVTAEAGGLKASINVIVGQDSMVIDNFEHNDLKRYNIDGYIGGTASIASGVSKSGKYSLKVSYDTKGWTKQYNGTINIRPTFEDKNGNDINNLYTTFVRPKKIGMWVYGDGRAPWLRAVLTDGESNKRTVDIVQRINWTGWKYVDADIPSDMPLPISLDYFYMVECDKSLSYKGTVYFDDIRFTYTDNEDFKGPEFYNFKPDKNVYSSSTVISLSIKDKSGVDKKSIRTRLDGKAVTASFNEATGVLTYNAKNLTKGIHTFEVEASDKLSNSANPYFKRTFTVDLDKDVESPVISNITPLNNSVVKTSTPRISFNIKDNRSGVLSSDIFVYVDDKRLSAYYDWNSGWGYALPENLSKGEHTVLIYAKDKAGNMSDKITYKFTVDPIKGPDNGENFTVSFVSDSHDEGYAYEIYNIINSDNSQLVIQNGDIIDNDSQDEWQDAQKEVSIIKNKPIMFNAGNHEAFSGNLNNYIKNFGSPTYSFEFGNSLFISLNSAIGQSITASDPTQFDYLQRLLNKTNKNNIFIYTHVPTRDSFKTGHQMVSSDASKLESMLSDYKKKYPSKNINVVFGHLHVFQSYSVGGVVYTIDGNAGNKRYVSPKDGGFLSYTKFTVSGNSVYKKVVPVVQNISILDTLKDISGEMKLPAGCTKQINLYGDFSMLYSDYIIPLTSFREKDVVWQTDNPSVVSVDKFGVIKTLKAGTANIRANLLGKTAEIKIIVTDKNDIIPAGFSLIPSYISILSGKSVTLEAAAYDIYGNSYDIDNSLINFKVDNILGSIKNGVFTASSTYKDVSGEITVEFKGLTAKCKVDVVKLKTKYVTITASSLTVRDTASIKGKELGKLAKGTKVEVIDEVNGWYKINFNGKIGYILKDYTK
ncbi:Calcineurin-like phosphoesterase [Caloramator quimbayensis]|uniref:Calcineurin-like phosphoesterase n=1 Tax=Caloramator quimbayensis TaxID=1147123 RepID=A0A1T4Y3M1_9CLOT|nr:phosphodiester glycosidase family protein [Caloramator quimbayensis]SKA96424.1 Calcineurin-like phosphoesterase [Caloramator quimbayensis]